MHCLAEVEWEQSMERAESAAHSVIMMVKFRVLNKLFNDYKFLMINVTKTNEKPNR